MSVADNPFTAVVSRVMLNSKSYYTGFVETFIAIPAEVLLGQQASKTHLLMPEHHLKKQRLPCLIAARSEVQLGLKKV